MSIFSIIIVKINSTTSYTNNFFPVYFIRLIFQNNISKLKSRKQSHRKIKKNFYSLHAQQSWSFISISYNSRKWLFYQVDRFVNNKEIAYRVYRAVIVLDFFGFLLYREAILLSLSSQKIIEQGLFADLLCYSREMYREIFQGKRILWVYIILLAFWIIWFVLPKKTIEWGRFSWP